MAKQSNEESVPISAAIVGTILIIVFLLGGCMYVMDCAGGSMTGGPPASWCPF